MKNKEKNAKRDEKTTVSFRISPQTLRKWESVCEYSNYIAGGRRIYKFKLFGEAIDLLGQEMIKTSPPWWKFWK